MCLQHSKQNDYSTRKKRNLFTVYTEEYSGNTSYSEFQAYENQISKPNKGDSQQAKGYCMYSSVHSSQLCELAIQCNHKLALGNEKYQ